MSQYRVLLVVHEEGFLSEFLKHFEPDQSATQTSFDNTPFIKSGTNTDDNKIEYYFLVANLEDQNLLKSFSNDIFSIRPNATFWLGFGTLPFSRDVSGVDIATQLYLANSVERADGSQSYVRVHREFYGTHLSLKLLSHCNSESWADSFNKSGFNDRPEGKKSGMMFFCPKTYDSLNDIVSDYPEVDICDRSPLLAGHLATFRDQNVHILRAPCQEFESRKAGFDATASLPKKKSAALLATYVQSFCESDFKNSADFYSQDSARGKNPKSKGGTASGAKIKIDTPKIKDGTKKILKSEGNAAWNIIRKHLIDGVIGVIKFTLGSVVIEGNFTNRDRAILNVLCRTHLLSSMLPYHMYVEDYVGDFDSDSLPLEFLEFLDDIEMLIDRSRTSSGAIRDFGLKWEENPVFGKVAVEIANNVDLQDDMESCG